MINLIQQFVDFLWGTPLIVLLLITGLLFTFGSKFFQVIFFKHILSQTLGTLFKKKEKDDTEKGLVT